MKINTSRIYDDEETTGLRVLIDRLWPRGISKARASLDYWARDLAPSDQLRQWYKHDPDKWEEFKHRYFLELDANPISITALLELIADRDVTFLFSSRERHLNNAHALKEYIEQL